MEFGVLFPANDLSVVAERARVAEEVGFDLVAIPDSQSLFRDVYVALTLAAQATSRVRLGPMVSNVVTRHLAVTVSAIASVDEVSGGRAVLGLGTGDSAVLNAGGRPSSVRAMRDAVQELHELLHGRTVEAEGHSRHVRWVRRPVPVWLAAEGPRMLALTAAHADGVLIGTGLTSEVIRHSLEQVRTAAVAAGRSPEAVEAWFFAKSEVADSREAALAANKMALAASANHAFRFTREGKLLPEELKPRVEELISRYDHTQHEQHGPTINARLPDELGLTDYLADRFGVFGTPAECIAKVERMAQAGAQRVLFTTFAHNTLHAIRRLGKVVAYFKR